MMVIFFSFSTAPPTSNPLPPEQCESRTASQQAFSGAKTLNVRVCQKQSPALFYKTSHFDLLGGGLSEFRIHERRIRNFHNYIVTDSNTKQLIKLGIALDAHILFGDHHRSAAKVGAQELLLTRLAGPELVSLRSTSTRYAAGGEDVFATQKTSSRLVLLFSLPSSSNSSCVVGTGGGSVWPTKRSHGRLNMQRRWRSKFTVTARSHFALCSYDEVC